jgi:hypothetical protein
VYGSQGVNIAGVGNTLPAYAATSTTGIPYTWAASTTDVRAAQNLTGSSRVAAEWYGESSFDFNLTLSDGGTHRIALYLLDYDGQNREENIQVIDANTNAVLATKTVFPFSGGDYALFNVSGSVIFRITKMSGGGSALTGVFIDPANGPALISKLSSTPMPTPAPAARASIPVISAAGARLAPKKPKVDVVTTPRVRRRSSVPSGRGASGSK